MCKFESYIRYKAIAMVIENLGISLAARLFHVDYRNMCAYVNGRKPMPIKLCFAIFEYLDAKVVVFRSQLNF